jgi:hypothetical protein
MIAVLYPKTDTDFSGMLSCHCDRSKSLYFHLWIEKEFAQFIQQTDLVLVSKRGCIRPSEIRFEAVLHGSVGAVYQCYRFRKNFKMMDSL